MVMRMRQKKTRIDEEPVLDFHETGHDVKSVADSTCAAPSSPIRTCVVARERRSDSELLRFVLSPDGDVVPDLKRKLPGRGVWLTPGRDKVLEAVRRRAFDRGFRQKVKAGPELADLVQQLMQRAAVESLSLANKAGLAITGFEKLSHAIGRGEILVLVHAAGASPEGVAKLNGRLARSLGEKSYIEPIICLTSAEIGLATGRPNVIHAGLKEGGASRAFLQAIQRLLRYQGQPRQAGLPVQDEV
jgi:predicted RNA-binding protein YlxR (DUF448 family)